MHGVHGTSTAPAVTGPSPGRSHEEWPGRRLLITAIDAVTGEFTVFHAGSGVSLVDAVGAAARCRASGRR
jgi:hypothetical protein